MSDAGAALPEPVGNLRQWRRHLAATVLVSLAVSVLGVASDAQLHVVERLSELDWPAHLLAIGPGIAVLCIGVAAYAYGRHMDSKLALEREARTRAAFEASESRYRQLVENAVDAIVVHVEGKVAYANPSALQLMGATSADEVIGTPVLQRMHPAYREAVTARIASMLTSGVNAEAAFEKFLRLDGSVVDAEVRANPVVYEGKTGVQVMIRDLTEREEFQRSLKRYELLSEHAQDIVLFIEPGGRLLDCNRAAERAYGYSREKLLTMYVRDIRDPDFRDHTQTQIAAAFTGGIRFETRHLRRDGTSFDVEVDSHSVEFEGDRLIISVCRDITSRKAAERQLVESERQYRSIIERSPVASVVLSPAMKVRLANESALTMLGMPEGAPLVGREVVDFLDTASVDRINAAVEQLRAFDHSVRIEEIVLSTAGATPISADVVAAPVVLDGERCYLALIQPVSERKKVEIALRQSVMHTARTMARLVAVRDPYTSRHQQRVAALSSVIADRMGLTLDEVAAVRLAAEVHDVGKIVVPAELLSKPGKLSEHEMALIREHAQAGYDILKDIPFPWDIADIVRQHHERLDGSGYPMGIAGDDIGVEARIIAVADVVEAVASYRPYRPALGIDAALQIIQEGSGALYDPSVVEACVALSRGRDSLAELLESIPLTDHTEPSPVESR